MWATFLGTILPFFGSPSLQIVDGMFELDDLATSHDSGYVTAYHSRAGMSLGGRNLVLLPQVYQSIMLIEFRDKPTISRVFDPNV